MRNKVYAVHANRVLSKHCYLVGIYDKKHAAQKAALKEQDYRGGKYVCTVDEWVINDGIEGSSLRPDYPKRISVK